jgi:hypothetical protein
MVYERSLGFICGTSHVTCSRGYSSPNITNKEQSSYREQSNSVHIAVCIFLYSDRSPYLVYPVGSFFVSKVPPFDCLFLAFSIALESTLIARCECKKVLTFQFHVCYTIR